MVWNSFRPDPWRWFGSSGPQSRMGEFRAENEIAPLGKLQSDPVNLDSPGVRVETEGPETAPNMYKFCSYLSRKQLLCGALFSTVSWDSKIHFPPLLWNMFQFYHCTFINWNGKVLWNFAKHLLNTFFWWGDNMMVGDSNQFLPLVLELGEDGGCLQTFNQLKMKTIT